MAKIGHTPTLRPYAIGDPISAVRTVVALTIIVSLPLVLFTYLVQTDVVDISVFSEYFSSGLEKTQELKIKLQNQIEEKIDKIFLP